MRRRVKFAGWRHYWFGLSGAMLLVAVVSLLVQGLNLGIDFTGGSLMNLTFKEPVTTSQVRSALQPFGLEMSVITIDQKDPTQVMVRTHTLTEEERRDVVAALGKNVAEITAEDVHLVTPVVAKDLVQLAMMALLIAFVGMLVYITFRFEIKYAVPAILALLHDATITLGFLSVTRIELSSAFVAAILTIVGYSINDTIVVFDRIRENLKYSRKEELGDLVDRSIYETLPRTINTVVTTLLAIAAVYLFGGQTTRHFALTLMVGIALGTYSSFFVATPLWYVWKAREPHYRRQARTPEAPARAEGRPVAVGVTPAAAPEREGRAAGAGRPRAGTALPAGSGAHAAGAGQALAGAGRGEAHRGRKGKKGRKGRKGGRRR
ncbi:MAG: protein translocase subunit SecF [Acetobacteraceae bacterium]|nr:protein translocase subunit SecF [Acetobacteraceae bacterium]